MGGSRESTVLKWWAVGQHHIFYTVFGHDGISTLTAYSCINKCIGDDTKAAARRSLKCIRKTKKYSEERFHCGSGIITLNSRGGSTLQRGTWLWYDIHATEFAQTSPILEFCFRFWLRPYRHSRHVILHQFAKFYPNRTARGRKMASCWF